MMGARTLIDMVILKHVGDVGSFPQKLGELKAKGFLSEKNLEILQAALEAGNAAAHRGHQAEPKHLNQVMDIVENLLQTLVLQGDLDELKKATPPRKISKSK